MKKNKYKLVLAGLLGLSLPLLSLADYNDVTLTTDTVVVLGGVNVSISSSDALVESVVSDTNVLAISMKKNSTVTIVSAGARTINIDSGTKGLTVTTSCTSSAYTVTITAQDTAAVDFSIGPVCTVPAASTSSSSSGSSAGSTSGPSVSRPQTVYPDGRVVYHDEPATEPVTPPTSTPVVAPANVSAVFDNNLKFGTQNADVTRLQKLLATDPEIYPLGKVTGYFGTATENAVKKFQQKYKIIPAGVTKAPGFGIVGPLTRAKITEVFGGSAVPGSVTPAPVTPINSGTGALPPKGSVSNFTRPLDSGSIHGEVKILQQILNSDVETKIADSGVGSPGKETSYYGALTKTAVQKFQIKYGIAKEGDSGFGTVGPKTRAKLNDIINR